MGALIIRRAGGTGLGDGEEGYVFVLYCSYFAFYRHPLFQIAIHKSLSVPRQPVGRLLGEGVGG